MRLSTSQSPATAADANRQHSSRSNSTAVPESEGLTTLAAWRLRPSPLALSAIAFAVLLVAYNNVMYSTYSWAFPTAWILYLRAILLPAAAICAGVWMWRLSPREMGLSTRAAAPSATVGLGLATVAAAPICLYLVFPVGLPDGSFDFRNIEGVSNSIREALYWAFVLYPLHTVIFEEILFRGVLQGLAVRAFTVRPGVAFTAAAFALWHVATDYSVLSNAAIADNLVLFILLQIVVLVGIFGGGLVLGTMRQLAGNLFTPIAFHWGFLVSLGGVLFLLAR